MSSIRYSSNNEDVELLLEEEIQPPVPFSRLDLFKHMIKQNFFCGLAFLIVICLFSFQFTLFSFFEILSIAREIREIRNHTLLFLDKLNATLTNIWGRLSSNACPRMEPQVLNFLPFLSPLFLFLILRLCSFFCSLVPPFQAKKVTISLILLLKIFEILFWAVEDNDQSYSPLHLQRYWDREL